MADITVVNQIADQTATTASLANTSLTFAVVVGTRYMFRFYICWRTTGTGVGLQLGMTTPTFTTFAATVRILIGSATATAEFQGALTTSGDSVVGTAAATANADLPAVVEGVILPSANGFITLQFAAETTGQTVTFRKGSTGELVIT